MRDAFLLDPDRVHLNHGSYGAVPRVVEEAQRWQRDWVEANPSHRIRYDVVELVAQARATGAAFLDVEAESVALVPNVTHAVAVVLSSLARQGRLRAGDVVVTSTHGYGAVRDAISLWCSWTGATTVPVAHPVGASSDDVVEAFARALDTLARQRRRVALVVVDAITSPTATCLPVRRLTAVCRSAGALSLVDAAHVPGQLPDGPGESGADFWTGAFHKWAFAARGTSALWASEGERQDLAPLTTSWGHGSGFPGAFDAHGTDDYSAWLALPDALAFWDELGGDAIAVRASALLERVVPLVDSAIAALGMPRAPSALPASPAPQMRLVPLPDDIGHTRESSDALIRDLGEQGVETAVVPFEGRGYLRLSAAPYNEWHDYERLATVLSHVIAPGRTAAPAEVAHPW